RDVVTMRVKIGDSHARSQPGTSEDATDPAGTIPDLLSQPLVRVLVVASALPALLRRCLHLFLARTPAPPDLLMPFSRLFLRHAPVCFDNRIAGPGAGEVSALRPRLQRSHQAFDMAANDAP